MSCSHSSSAGHADIAAASAILESVGLGARAHALPAQLSGGELARAGLAVALANDPPLLLADEPTGELDSDTADQIVSLLRSAPAPAAPSLPRPTIAAWQMPAHRHGRSSLDGRVAT